MQDVIDGVGECGIAAKARRMCSRVCLPRLFVSSGRYGNRASNRRVINRKA